MKKGYKAFFVFFIFVFLGLKMEVFAQEFPVMYFCEKYGKNGEVGISDRFTVGYITVVVKSDYKLNLRSVHIQFDKYDCRKDKFEFYKKFDYTLEPDMKYVYFSKNDESDMSFDEPGFYRVFLLDDADETVASAIVEIIDK
ncbi:MAG: hypothetical protein HXY50_16490 [Ignavibacteriaceae bacterium]|nr:hypothetical protein [Ignavibacteriaceae bacterium]